MDQGLCDSSRQTEDLLIPKGLSYSRVREILKAQGYQQRDGHNLSSDGLYRETITTMCFRNPTLRRGHVEYATNPSEYGRVAILTIPNPTQPPSAGVSRKEIANSKDLRSYLEQARPPSCRRIVLLESVARNFVEVLGSHFNMNPSLFSKQTWPKTWGLTKFDYGKAVNLPSLNDPKNHFLMRYPELRYFPLVDGFSQINSHYIRDLNGHRRIDLSRRKREFCVGQQLEGGEFDNVGVVHRAASYWSRKYDDGGWDGMCHIPLTTHRTDLISYTFAR